MKKILNLLLLCWCANAFSEGKANILSIQDLLAATKQHYPAIMAEQQELARAKAAYFASQGGFDPNISSRIIATPAGTYNNRYWDTQLNFPISDTGNQIFAGYRYGQGNFPSYDQYYLTENKGEGRVGFNMPLLRDRDIDQNRAALQTTRLGIGIQEQNLQLTRINIMQEAALAYYRWVAEGIRLRYTQELLNIAKIRQEAIEKRFRLGDAAKIEVQENQRFIVQRKAALIYAERQLQKAAFYLSLFYRNSQGKPMIPRNEQLPSFFPAIPNMKMTVRFNSVLKEKLVDQFPSVEILQAKIATQRVQLSVAKNNLQPTLNMQLFYAQDVGSNTTNVRINDKSLNLQLVFDVPFYQRKAKGNITETMRSLDSLAYQEKLMREKLAITIKDLFYQLEAERQQFKMAEQDVRLSKTIEDAENKRFNNGDSSLFLVNQREQTTFDARLREIGAINAYYNTYATLLTFCRFDKACLQKLININNFA